jgi:hypothetical protein
MYLQFLSAGVVTFSLNNNQNFTGIVTISSFKVSGASTFTGAIDANGNLDVDGHTELDDLNVSGVSTFVGDVSIADKIIHTGDTDTAIRFPANDTFTVETAGAERLRVTNAGDVGIGTNAPNSKLHIKGSSALSNLGQIVLIQDDINDDSVDLGGTLGLTGIVNGNHRTLGVIKAGKEDAGTSFSGYLGFFTRVNGVGDAQERIRITSSGNVGIGTDAPSQTLDVNGNVRFRNALYDNTNSDGDPNQILSSTGSGIAWITPSSAASGTEILSQQASTPYYITASDVTSGVSTAGFIDTTIVAKDGLVSEPLIHKQNFQ